MDRIDRKILTLLQENADIALAELSDKVGLSQTPCWKRIQKLQQSGVITKKVALVSPEKIGSASRSSSRSRRPTIPAPGWSNSRPASRRCRR